MGPAFRYWFGPWVGVCGWADLKRVVADDLLLCQSKSRDSLIHF